MHSGKENLFDGDIENAKNKLGEEGWELIEVEHPCYYFKREKPCIEEPTGATGPTGPASAIGDTGATGPSNQIPCSERSRFYPWLTPLDNTQTQTKKPWWKKNILKT